MGEPTLTPASESGAKAVSGVDPVTVLLLDTHADGPHRVERALNGAGVENFRVEWVTRVGHALERLPKGDVDVVLVGMSQGVLTGTEAFDRIHGATSDALVLPLSPGDSTGTDANAGEKEDPAPPSLGEDHWLPDALSYVSQRKRVENALRGAEEVLFEEKERAQVTLNSIGDAVLVTDTVGHVTYLNPMAEEMTGWSGPDAVGKPLCEVFRIIDGTTREAADLPAERAMRQDETVGLAANCVLVRPDGTESGIEDSAAPIHDRHGGVSGAVIVFRDVSQSRDMARKMAYLAQHDTLTGLANRILLEERVDQALRQARRSSQRIALLFVDLCNFKRINDAWGHLFGDHVLQEVARILTDQVRETDTVSRQGGDEFVVLLTNLENPEDAARAVENLTGAFAEPIEVDGDALSVEATVGISVYPDDGPDMESLLHHADQAMYWARDAEPEEEPTRYAFSPMHGQSPPIRGRAEEELFTGFKKGELVLHYQPQFEVSSGRELGVEALVRWQQPLKGLVFPGQFIPLAERSGLIVPIGHWVMQEACEQVREWQRSGQGMLPVAINVSVVELEQSSFCEGLAAILRLAGLAPGNVELELTETALMEHPDTVLATLKKLKELGVRLALDDFGTGFSSLSYLRRFPIDTLKIDQSFLGALKRQPESAVLLRSIIGMGKSLGQRVVAEGVETAEQLGFLRDHGCDGAQGFGLARPQEAEGTGSLALGNRPRGTAWNNPMLGPLG